MSRCLDRWTSPAYTPREPPGNLDPLGIPDPSPARHAHALAATPVPPHPCRQRHRAPERDAIAAFEVYTQSAAARTVALATADTVRTRHGLVLLTTSTREAPALSRVVVPGPDDVAPRLRHWADGRGLDVESLRAETDGAPGGGGGFASALQNLAEHTDATTASSTAKMIGYPTAGVDLQRGHTQLRAVLLALVILALAVLVGLAPASVVRHRRGRVVA